MQQKLYVASSPTQANYSKRDCDPRMINTPKTKLTVFNLRVMLVQL
jgi:hypothetical protein